jgi:hypothetical protein
MCKNPVVIGIVILPPAHCFELLEARILCGYSNIARALRAIVSTRSTVGYRLNSINFKSSFGCSFFISLREPVARGR